ncbi:hypothetical protein [Glycomyces tenuis]|uniref:hypothetical protein n=1 Tax=Glycomyces tenuis TaxID=58116 RepID=UPI0003FF1E33|nr:hypothetical protein [Glycomyces tenuis]
MRPIRWATGVAHTLRGLVTRVHRRTEPLPQLPFGIAVGVSILLLLMAIETGPDPDAAVSEVDELSLLDDGEGFGDTYATMAAELEIVEFGFGRVVDRYGQERLSLGAIIRNPHDAVVMPSTLAVMSENAEGSPFTVEQVYLDHIPAESSVPVGYVLLEPAGDIDEGALDLVIEDAQMWDPPGGTDAGSYPFGEEMRRPQVAVVDIEPLFSPEGYRVSYQVEAQEHLGYVDAVKIAIVFRDVEGTIVGGLPGWGDPFGDPNTVPGYRSIPPGVSLQYIDLLTASIPEGADLNRIEIGPGV